MQQFNSEQPTAQELAREVLRIIRKNTPYILKEIEKEPSQDAITA